MDIRDIDKNFLQNSWVDKDSLDFYSITEPPFALYGVFYDEKEGRFLRMPQTIADAVNEGVGYLNRHTAGGRVRFSTDSRKITLLIEYGGLEIMPHMAISGCCGFTLCKNEGGREILIGGVYPMPDSQEQFVWTTNLPTGTEDFTLYFPLYQGVKKVYIGVDKGSSLRKGKGYKNTLPILYYGSSITQGGCASRADTAYQAFICKRNNVDFINMGFSGSAKAEPQMMDYLASLDCSVFVFDYDHNAETAAYLQNTHFVAYKRYREKKPDVPIVFISRPNAPCGEDTAQRFAIIRASYEKAKAEGDAQVYLIDGRTLLANEWENSTVDGCHPTDLGFYQMSLQIGRTIDEILKNKK